MDEAKTAVLFVCRGNLCRSPTAEVVLRRQLAALGLDQRVIVRSAGTHAHWPAGQRADPRAVSAALRRGYDLSRFTPRALKPGDFEDHTVILSMDDDIHARLIRWCPPDRLDRLNRFAKFGTLGSVDVPDPYYGPPAGFDRVLDLIENAAAGWVKTLQEQGLPS